MKGERLSKSQTRTLQADREKHLTVAQRNLLAKGRLDRNQSEQQLRDAQATLVRIGTTGGPVAKTEANRVVQAAKQVLRKAEVSLSVLEQTMGIRDAGKLRSPDFQQSPQGGPLPGQTPAPVRKSAGAVADDPRLGHLAPEQRAMHAKACQEVRAAEQGHASNHEAYLNALEDGHTSRLGPATRRREVSAKALHDAQVRLSVLRKNLGLGP
jgi:hypothetical protein